MLCGYNVDTLKICMKEFIIFVCTDSTEIFLSKLRSSCSNYNLPSFFTDSYCAGGVSNKHCLLTFFISTDYGEIEIPPAPETVATYDITGPRLMISKIVNENFKSYAGVRALGPFHKVCHSPPSPLSNF